MEKEYYIEWIKLLLFKLFALEINPKFRSGGKNGCSGVQTTKKPIVRFFLENEFMPGSKTWTVRVPSCIKDASSETKTGLIAGLFDTDGRLRFDKNGTREHVFPRLEFSTVSVNPKKDLSELFRELGFKFHVWGKYDRKVGLTGKVNLEKFILEIRPKNTKHLNKYLLWKRYGYYDATVAQPGTART